MLNAIQHMAQKPTDHHRLTVKTYYEEEAPGQEIIITVSDTGPGIHKKHLEHIFNLGFTTRDEGSGLGLYIANSLIESFGGKLIVKESIIPLGTEFLIELQRATLVTN